MAWHKRFQPEKSFLEDELETVVLGGSDVVLGSAVSRMIIISLTIIVHLDFKFTPVIVVLD